MIIVGLTGGIGSGKSTVCKIFEVLGIPVFYADDESKKILFLPHVSKEVISAFGNKVVTNNILDKKKLGTVVFSSVENLTVLNQILHPKVAQRFKEWSSVQRSKYVIKEAAILFESGSYKSCDFVINVSCSVTERIKRVLERDNRSKEQIKNIISKQLSEDERVNLSSFIIKNEKDKLIPQVLSIDYHIQNVIYKTGK
jgi:dephospho-CoA kinase